MTREPAAKKKTRAEQRAERKRQQAKQSLINLGFIAIGTLAFFSWLKSDHSKQVTGQVLRDMTGQQQVGNFAEKTGGIRKPVNDYMAIEKAKGGNSTEWNHMIPEVREDVLSSMRPYLREFNIKHYAMIGVTVDRDGTVKHVYQIKYNNADVMANLKNAAYLAKRIPSIQSVTDEEYVRAHKTFYVVYENNNLYMN